MFSIKHSIRNSNFLIEISMELTKFVVSETDLLIFWAERIFTGVFGFLG